MSKKPVLILAAVLGVILSGYGVTRVRLVHLEHFCSNVKSWRITMSPPTASRLELTNGVYRVTSYSLSNGFGLRPPGQSWLTAPAPLKPTA